jgi:hypothetical protein
MTTLQQHIAPIANLIAQLRELEGLREQVKKAEQARSPRVDRNVGTHAQPPVGSGPANPSKPGDGGGWGRRSRSSAEKECSFGSFRRR